jgi:hypothetical protein
MIGGGLVAGGHLRIGCKSQRLTRLTVPKSASFAMMRSSASSFNSTFAHFTSR